ncbi:hypothetical protein [Terriglobus albidus]|uniref:hypothetical protein n=1 Tax=Terriglobus albidus TaxID=1592106 RepID=UPI0021E01CC9|nr:hypothetical protein [Terriglobus albidus]
MRLLRNYIFWTYERGSLHYDIMVTLILAFLFISPHYIDFKDRPQDSPLEPTQTLVQQDGAGYVYTLRPQDIHHDTGDLDGDLLYAVVQYAGPVTMDRYEVVKDAHGKVSRYKVWVHRP